MHFDARLFYKATFDKNQNFQNESILNFLLYESVLRGNVPEVLRLIKAGGNPLLYDEMGRNLLHLAALYGHLPICKILVEEGLSINTVTSSPKSSGLFDPLKKEAILSNQGLKGTPLLFAVIGNSVNVVSWLLSFATIDKNYPNSLELPLLLLALENGYEEIVDILIKHGEDINKIVFYHNAYCSLLHILCLRGSHEGLSKFLSYSLKVDIFDSFGETPLHICSRLGNYSSATLLVQKGANLNLTNALGETPLYLASENNHDNLVTYFLDQKANPKIFDNDFKTPLSLQYVKKNPLPKDCLELLKNADDDFSNSIERIRQIGNDFGLRKKPFLQMNQCGLELQMESIRNCIAETQSETLGKALSFMNFCNLTFYGQKLQSHPPVLIPIVLPSSTVWIGFAGNFLIKKQNDIEIYRISKPENLEFVLNTLISLQNFSLPLNPNTQIKLKNYDNFVQIKQKQSSHFLSQLNELLELDLDDLIPQDDVLKSFFFNGFKMSCILSNVSDIKEGLQTYKMWENYHVKRNVDHLLLILKKESIRRIFDSDQLLMKVVETLFSQSHVSLLDRIFTEYPHLLNGLFLTENKTPLFTAVLNGDLFLINFLLKKGVYRESLVMEYVNQLNDPIINKIFN